MNPHRVSPRILWLAFLPCVLAFSLVNSASAQNPSEPSQQPATSPQSAPQPAQQSAPASSQAEPDPTTQQPSAPAQAATKQPAKSAPQKTQAGSAGDQQKGEITEDELKQMLVGKTLYLRGGFLDDSLSFNEYGMLVSHSTVGSFTLSLVEIDKVHLTNHKVELEGERYGIHFSNQLAYEDPRTSYDKVRITPKKKELRITIDREALVKPKKFKLNGKTVIFQNGQVVVPPATSAPVPAASAPAAPAQSSGAQPASAAPGQPSQPADDEPDTDQAKAEIAAAKPEDRPADPGSVTATTKPDHATMVLKKALDNIFASGLDDRMMDAMPDYWRLYYQAVAEKKDYRPADPSVMPQSKVDKKARLLSNFEPESNQFAQDKAVAGVAVYHAVIEPDGTPGEIAVARPIGFGLDESAVKSIRAARFEPAVKDGKPVAVLVDLVVQFRIYSNRTNVTAPPQPESNPSEPSLPGPYSVQHPAAAPQPEQSQQQPDQSQQQSQPAPQLQQ